MLAGCDGGFAVKGELAGSMISAKTGCMAWLEKDGQVTPYSNREIGSALKADWTVEPYWDRYDLVVKCPGYAEERIVIEPGAEGRIGPRIDLGRIKHERLGQ